jgi:hypothetical protein
MSCSLGPVTHAAIQKGPAVLQGPQPHTQFSEREEEAVTKKAPYLMCSILALQQGLRVSLVSLHDFTDEETEALRREMTCQVTGHLIVSNLFSPFSPASCREGRPQGWLPANT